jgi:hypothetical protein
MWNGEETMQPQLATNHALQALKLEGKATPFGAHFAVRLEGVNSKLVCALSRMCQNCDPEGPPPGPGTCVDDA